jgi:radical SAM protein with 4Fe4S-binding SPASM domain
MKRLSYPIDVQIELTEACNQKCQHCYNFWRYDSEVVKKDELNADKFLLVLEKLNECGVSMITLTGGEPLLRPEIFFTLLKQAKKYNMEVGLNSNAVLINKEMAEKMFEAGLDHALISVLGIESTHDSVSNLLGGFKKTCQGISNLVEAGVPVAVNMVASKLNQDEIYQVGKIIKDLGVKTFCVTPMVPSHKSHRQYLLTNEECKNSLRSLLKIRDDFGLNIDTLEPLARCMFKDFEDDEFVSFFGNRICSAAVSSCAISSKGNIRPCIHSDKEFGNILLENISEIWEKMKFWSSPEILPKKCTECNANIICEGGCRMSAKTINGCYDGNDMYMTEPIMDFARIKKLPAEKIFNFNNDDLLMISNNVRFRKEEFGWIVYVYNNIEFCTDEGFNFIKELQKKDNFTVNGLIKDFNFSEELIIPVINKFIKSKIISIIN